MIEAVTAEELAVMAKVKAVLVDREWFQVYDNANKFTEKYVASGLYWNYFFHVWKTVSSSPFSNAIVFVDSTATITAPSTISLTVTDITKSGNAAIYTLTPADPASLQDSNLEFLQDSTSTQNGIAVHKYGAVIVPIAAGAASQVSYTAKAKLGDATYTASSAIYVDEDDTPVTGHSPTAVGDTITLAIDT